MIIDEIKPNGFCNGVIRAIKMINECINNKETPRPIYMFGQLVHNKNVIKAYEKDCIIISKNNEKFLDTIKEGTVVFTAHGINPSIKEKVLKKGLNVVDTTCPNVIKIQNLIKDKLKENYEIGIIGSNNHPEVLSYLGIDKNVHMKDYNFKSDKIFFVNQTTLIYDDAINEFNKLNEIYPNSKMAFEICDATKKRQFALKENLNNYDAFIIIGDVLSNNCDSLYKLCINNDKKAYKINDINDLKDINIYKYQKVAVTAAASTPPAIVNEVINKLKNNDKNFKSDLKILDYIKI